MCDFTYGNIANNMSFLKFNKVMSIFRSNLRMMSINSTRKFEGKVAVVTASTDGIGYAIANRLAYDGAKVMASSRKGANVKRAVELLQKEHGSESVSGVVCHVGKDEDRKSLIKEVIKQFGQIDILVDNAAVNPSPGKLLHASEGEWNKICHVNVISSALLVQEAYPYMKVKGGNIVFVSSYAGFKPKSVYCVSKMALFGLTIALANELGEDNIRVNCIAPGLIKTRFGECLWKNETYVDNYIESRWINRMSEPEDCSGAVAFLCSEEASYITGETITMAGKSARI